jgi:hypothetical protein
VVTGTIPPVGRFEPAQGEQARLGETMRYSAVPDGVHDAPRVDAAAHAAPGGRPFTSETAREAARTRWALERVPDFATRELEFTPAADFAPFDAARRIGLDARRAEVFRTFNAPVSVGVSSVLRGWAWCVSFGEYYATRAARSGSDDDADRSARFFQRASIELAKAHDLARAESAAHRSPGSPEDDFAAAGMPVPGVAGGQR